MEPADLQADWAVVVGWMVGCMAGGAARVAWAVGLVAGVEATAVAWVVAKEVTVGQAGLVD